MDLFMFMRRFFAGLIAAICIWNNFATVSRGEELVSSPSVILMESSTGTVLYEMNAGERRSPASITKIMTLLLTFEALERGEISLEDRVCTSEHAASMGGSQVFLEEGEEQSLDTMIKCITVASGNDASVAVAEHVAGSETAFVEQMNRRAEELGMADTHFEDCCGLSDSDNHYSCARDIAILTRELTLHYPNIFRYSGIWMEDITHKTKRGESTFTLSSTNKLLKQYPYITGLKTGSTSRAKFCISATASKDGVDLIAVVMGGPDSKTRFRDAKELLAYGFAHCRLYVDDETILEKVPLQGALQEELRVYCKEPFRYVETEGRSNFVWETEVQLMENLQAPVEQDEKIGRILYRVDGKVIGANDILAAETVCRATLWDYCCKSMTFLLL